MKDREGALLKKSSSNSKPSQKVCEATVQALYLLLVVVPSSTFINPQHTSHIFNYNSIYPPKGFRSTSISPFNFINQRRNHDFCRFYFTIDG
ncbi:hypothetical protein QVD17_27151 [Tagetes erecta]|uniref:Uncharacterized protein n=1 Tax=Tagetes erecta TaxID=13708 RepID=A0AAD8KE97_TARER|nr:hypothetical protein QVD17_27151 [Tagetes erecta]